MTPLHWMNDPELSGLIAEIAADPQSALFSSRPVRWTEPSNTATLLQPKRLDSSAAERKLIESYREDVAFLLRRAFALLVGECPLGREHFSRSEMPGEPLEPQLLGDVRCWVERRASASLDPEATAHARTAAHHLLEPGRSPLEAAIAVHEAARALVPHPASEVHRGILVFLLGGHFERSARESALAASTVASDLLRSIAWNNTAQAALEVGNTDLALRAARFATAAWPENMSAWAQQLTTASYAQQESPFLAALDAFMSPLPPTARVVSEAAHARAERVLAKAPFVDSMQAKYGGRMSATARHVLGLETE